MWAPAHPTKPPNPIDKSENEGSDMIRRRTMMIRALIAGAIALLSGSASAQTTLRFGHFPNVTHIQGLVAHALSRQGKGFLDRKSVV